MLQNLLKQTTTALAIAFIAFGFLFSSFSSVKTEAAGWKSYRLSWFSGQDYVIANMWGHWGACETKHPKIEAWPKKEGNQWSCWDTYWSWR